MMKKIKVMVAILSYGLISSFSAGDSKMITKSGYINIFSHTVAEDIKADNYKVTSTLDVTSGEMVFSVPMQGFEFEKALMQKHFNSPKFLDTKQFPKAKFKGTIINIKDIDLTKDGTYKAVVQGELDLHGVTKAIKESGTISVKGGEIIATSKFNIALADYKIAFEKGKPSTNIAKEVTLTIKMNYKVG